MNIRNILAIAAAVFYIHLWSQPSDLDYPYSFQATGNPLIKHIRIADPSCRVWPDGKLWMYASHDQDNATNYSSMDGYHVFSTSDLVNWVDHGEVLHSRNVSWGIEGGGWMWAPDCAFKNGKYYMYFPHKDKNGQFRTGVAISDRPEGPFIPEPNYIQGTSGIDPMCFIDDDGKAYLYFGNAKVALLKDNMKELAETPRNINYGTDNFREGPFMHKRNGIYYFSWTDWKDSNFQGYYAMGNNPYGPFTFKGPVNRNPPGAQDHHSIVKFHSQWYYFYHVGNYNGGSAHRRNTCVDSLFYNPDGTMKLVKMTTKGVGAERIGQTEGIAIPGKFAAQNFFDQKGTNVTNNIVESVNHTDFLQYVLDIRGTDPYTLTLHLPDAAITCSAKIYIDDELIDTIRISASESTAETQIDLSKGHHSLKLEFLSTDTTSDLLALDSISLFSGNTYFAIESSAATGGKIVPAGSEYYPTNSNATYTFDSKIGYRLNNVLVDAVSVGTVPGYTFEDITSAHSIEAEFESCVTSASIQVQINQQTPEAITELDIAFGDTVRLMGQANDNGSWQWYGPRAIYSTLATFSINGINSSQSGTYYVIYTSENGCKSKHSVDINVLPPTLDAYQAEDYTAQSGISIESSNDIWQGQSIGFIQNGDWAEYTIAEEKDGWYDLSYRVASGSSGGNIVFTIDGVVLNAKAIGSTGGWTTWETTQAVRILLDAGTHTVRLRFTGGSGYLFNLNWFSLEYAGPVTQSSIEIPGTEVFPNPAQNTITVRLNKTIDSSIKIIDSTGRICKSFHLKGEQINLDISKLTSGSYSLLIEKEKITKEFIKL